MAFVFIYPNLNVPSSNPLPLERFSYMYLHVCLPRFLHPSESTEIIHGEAY